MARRSQRCAGARTAALLPGDRAPPRLRSCCSAALVALPLLAGGWLWLRNSSLVAVEHVQVSGVHGAEAHAIERRWPAPRAQ